MYYVICQRLHASVRGRSTVKWTLVWLPSADECHSVALEADILYDETSCPRLACLSQANAYAINFFDIYFRYWLVGRYSWLTLTSCLPSNPSGLGMKLWEIQHKLGKSSPKSKLVCQARCKMKAKCKWRALFLSRCRLVRRGGVLRGDPAADLPGDKS